ncbi:MAG TPA: ABC transporter substrate-binding protein [Actinomycetes bacterium]|nr:ABC transporter substrate-binding protein [Actinomycetes bacterium]
MPRARRTVAALALGVCLVLALAGCSARRPADSGGTSRKGVKGGTLRIVNVADVDSLDPATAYAASSWALGRLYLRTLYSWDSTLPGDDIATPVPDIADGPPTLSSDRLTYTFRLRRGVRYAPPVNRQVVAADFVAALTRQLRGRQPAHRYAWMIKGAREFAAGKARRISGMVAVGGRVLRVTLVKPAPDFLSIVALPFFAPVPAEFASRSSVGAGYSKRVIGSGPYTLEGYAPGKTITFVRNKNWDPATDPLRRAWPDKIEVRVGEDPTGVQKAIEQHDADLNGDAIPPPNDDLQRLATDPSLQSQLGIKSTGCFRYLSLQTDAGPTAKLDVRRALNLAVDKQALLDAIGGRFAGTIASTILPPSVLGHVQYDLFETSGYKGDVDRAKALLAKAGYPHGLTLNYVGESTGQGPAVTSALRQSLARVGIKLRVKAYPGPQRYTRSLRLPAKKNEHHIGFARWCPDWPGDSARSVLAALLDGRVINPTANNNYGDYDNPKVDQLIDQALLEPDLERRTALWGQADRLAMEDAAWVPLVWDRQTFFWSYRVQNWRYSPWVANPDYANLWLDPYSP